MIKITWEKEKSDSPTWSSKKGVDQDGNKYSCTANGEVYSCTTKSGFTGQGWTAEEAYQNAMADRREVRAGATTANETYQERLGKVKAKLATIKVRLTEHEAKQKQYPNDWAYPGDLGYILEELTVIDEYLINENC